NTTAMIAIRTIQPAIVESGPSGRCVTGSIAGNPGDSRHQSRRWQSQHSEAPASLVAPQSQQVRERLGFAALMGSLRPGWAVPEIGPALGPRPDAERTRPPATSPGGSPDPG